MNKKIVINEKAGKGDKNSKAFEFVLGTLPYSEREGFKASINNCEEMKADLRFWEEQLIDMNALNETLEPKVDTWKKIITEVDPNAITSTDSVSLQKENSFWQRWFPWGLSAALSVALVLALSIGQFQSGTGVNIPVDYVAVLTDSAGHAKLTAVTKGDTQAMWLQWEAFDLPADKDLQIWAISKSDQETRSIAVIDDLNTRNVTLSDAHWRLITDAESLIITVEETGGSELDEPSEFILAKGVCVRLNRKEKAS